MSPLALSIRFLQTQPDSKLLELARAGHERAFEALVQRYRRPLLNYCRRLSRSEASAEDALQQALLQAWIALSASGSEVRDVRAWLYRIVHNVAVSNLRRPVDDQVREDQAGDELGTDQAVERRLALRDALAGLASLPELQRQVMLSTALEGQSHDEVARALGLSHGAVRGLIYRARATLRAAAAAVMPGPLISWATRQQVGSGRSVALAEMLTGSGAAGAAGALLKGGALMATAGALAGAAGVALNPPSHSSRPHRALAARVHSVSATLGTPGGGGGSSTASVSTVSVALRATGSGQSVAQHLGNAEPRSSMRLRMSHWPLGSASRPGLLTTGPGRREPGSGSGSTGSSPHGSGSSSSGEGGSGGSQSPSGSPNPGHATSAHAGSSGSSGGGDSSESGAPNSSGGSGSGGGGEIAAPGAAESRGSVSTASSSSDGGAQGAGSDSSHGGPGSGSTSSGSEGSHHGAPAGTAPSGSSGG